MTQPSLPNVPDPDAERIEIALREMIEAPCSPRQVWQRIEVSLAMAPPHRARRRLWAPAGASGWRRPIALAAAIAAVVCLALFLRKRPGPQTLYPRPVATGDYRLVEGLAVGRGAVLATDAKPASLSLGGYCRIDIDPRSVVALAGSDRNEEIVLREGTVTCDVNSGVGGFVVRTQLGTVSVKGTKFSVGLVDDADEWLKDSPTGGPPMLGKQLIVRVLSGVVVAAGTWGSIPIAAGEAKVIVSDVAVSGAPPAVAPAGGLVKPGDEPQYPKSYLAEQDHKHLPTAVARILPTPEQGPKVDQIMAEFEKGLQGPALAKKEELTKRSNELHAKAMQDPAIKQAQADMKAAFGDKPLVAGPTPQPMAAASIRYHEALNANKDYAGYLAIQKELLDVLVEEYDIKPTMEKLKAVLTPKQIEKIQNILEELSPAGVRRLGNVANRNRHGLYAFEDPHTAIGDMDLPADVAAKAKEVIKAAVSAHEAMFAAVAVPRDQPGSRREELKALARQAADADRAGKPDEAAKFRAEYNKIVGLDMPGTLAKVKALLSAEQGVEFDRRVKRLVADYARLEAKRMEPFNKAVQPKSADADKGGL